jgi:hypothetical protein
MTRASKLVACILKLSLFCSNTVKSWSLWWPGCQQLHLKHQCCSAPRKPTKWKEWARVWYCRPRKKPQYTILVELLLQHYSRISSMNSKGTESHLLVTAMCLLTLISNSTSQMSSERTLTQVVSQVVLHFFHMHNRACKWWEQFHQPLVQNKWKRQFISPSWIFL